VFGTSVSRVDLPPREIDAETAGIEQMLERLQ
jgi:hypothetical protein